MTRRLTVPLPNARFFNREWSWLHFNERVLEEAEDARNPLLERLKFVSIFASNLDEFFMVRVAGLYRQIEAGIERSGTDKRSPTIQAAGVAEILKGVMPRFEAALAEILAALRERGVRVLGVEDLDASARSYVERYYDEVIYPVLTPTVVGPTHPFPRLAGNTLYLVLRLVDQRARSEGDKKKAKKKKDRHNWQRLGFIGLPRVLPRFLEVGRDDHESRDFVPLESILVTHAASLFAGYDVESISAVRVTRDADIALDEATAEDLREAMAKKLLGRRHGAAVRLEHGARIEPSVLARVQENLETEDQQHYAYSGLMQPTDLMQIWGAVDGDGLKDEPLEPISPGERPDGIFEWLKGGPRLLFHPYHAFDPVSELVTEAAADPNVLAIKQTLYRTSGNSPIIRGLTRAAEAGKQVTVVVELRARFDEARNIEWATRLEQAGAHVVYGLVGLKTHCKALLVVRREPDGIRRYVHFGTGNYNDATARIYTDFGLMSQDELLGEDASALFNIITGATLPPQFNRIEVAPTGLRRRTLNLIAREADKSAPRSRGHIIAKMNSLVDREVIEALYEASRAGVKIDLIVRGICCLRPGVPGMSENIRVRSIVGRFLEHARIFYFKNGGQEELYLASADWMPRNLSKRIELMFPVDDPAHRRYIRRVLELQIKDTLRSRTLDADDVYTRVTHPRRKLDSQIATYELTKEVYKPKRNDERGPRRFVPIGRPAVARVNAAAAKT